MISLQKTYYPKQYSFAKLINMRLSHDEEKAVEALRKVTHDSVYGQMIRDAFIDSSDGKFRQLFSEMLSQIDDNKDMMYQILGYDAYNSLIAIKHDHETGLL